LIGNIKAESKEIGLGVQDCGKMNVEMRLVEKIMGKKNAVGEHQPQVKMCYYMLSHE
jgi:hypothetical protein